MKRVFSLIAISTFGLSLAVVGDTGAPDVIERPVHEQVLAQLRDQTNARTEVFPEFHPEYTVFNAEAPIPPQCYTKTDGHFNPCYVCHQNVVPGRENFMNDGSLQIEYAFSDVGMTNHWKNLFEDRSAAVAAISDDEILEWVDTDNYSALAPRLRAEGFQGWIPDLDGLHLAADAFDEDGFARDGSHWVAFNYKPMPSTFWPTNGSTDDVMIRLPEPFRTDSGGAYTRDIYLANLAIVEMLIKDLSFITTPAIDERQIGVDLNDDGALSRVKRIVRQTSYVGAATDVNLFPSLYPKGTEFLHTVRYVGVNEAGDIYVPKRMKEVRYMKKWQAYAPVVYQRYYQLEEYDKEAGFLPSYKDLGDHGLDNKFGWSVQGFIEDSHGELRTNTYEETLFCMGCHSFVGSTIDKTFGFPRKIDGAEGWGYINLRGMLDAPNMGEQVGEIETYLTRVGGGGEFRSNPEMFERWFHANGRVDTKTLAAAKDVYEIITPSRDRALELNKAYKVIVAEQDYIYGRDATVSAPGNVYDHIDNETDPTLPANRFYSWDIRLDWSVQNEKVVGD